MNELPRFVAFDPISVEPLAQSNSLDELAQKLSKFEKGQIDMLPAVYDRNIKGWLKDEQLEMFQTA